MIQVGQPTMIGVTFGDPSLSVAMRVFDTSGPITAWLAMTNFDGGSYNRSHTFSAVGSYSVKKVVFTDGTFTTRDTNYGEGDDALQVVDVGGDLASLTKLIKAFINSNIIGSVDDGVDMVASVQDENEIVATLEDLEIIP